MNVNEFAERIVFGRTLDDKLAEPPKLTFGSHKGGPVVDSLLSPHRAGGIEMQHSAGIGMQPPSERQLESEKGRGQLLHFLANHELLATELMALVLLKFPDAPRAFRQGVLVTLQEEQEHTRMYLRRMHECGVEFGTYPLSGQFWRVVEPMQSPMDFVSRLSLTFEQANLDYSFHFANVFRSLGDDTTSDLLSKIYRDEVGHVQHGLHWFRQWKDPSHSDWDAYQHALDFPMSPQRGKGTRCAFNRHGRVEAGLDQEFIDSIEVYRQSRGRAPTVRWFDPAAEVDMSKEVSEKERLLLNRLACDLEMLMIALCKQDDIVLLRELPSRRILKELMDAGFELPEFKLFQERDTLNERKLHDFAPWAWTPKNYSIAQSLFDAVRHRPETPTEKLLELHQKDWSVRHWETYSGGRLPFMANADTSGFAVSNLIQLKSSLAMIGGRGSKTAVFKANLSASGRGQRRLCCDGDLSKEDMNWLASIFPNARRDSEAQKTEQIVGVIEPELHRLLDLSFLWTASRQTKQWEFLGWSRARVTRGRRYAGARIGTPFADCDGRMKRFLLEDQCRRLRETQQWIEERIVPELEARGFIGNFGVDAFVFQDANGDLKIKPLVELNPRTTMGHIALHLEKRLAPGVVGEFRIFTRSEWKEHGPLLERHGVLKSNKGAWNHGVLRFAEVAQECKLIPALLVGNELVNEIVFKEP